MLNKKRTKIVSTLGPATQGEEQIKALIEAGVNVFRLNFSHGSHEYHQSSIDMIRKVEKEIHANVSILGDLCGPKIRIGIIEPMDLVKDKVYTICASSEYDSFEDKSDVIPISYERIHNDVKVGERIFIADGVRLLEVVEDGEIVRAIAKTTGGISSRKGVNFPDSDLKIGAVSEKDLSDLEFMLTQSVDWIALSFVMRASDINPIRAAFNKAGKTIPVIAKIEKNEAVDDINNIIREFDGLMVARGDLGIEVPIERLPIIQRDLIAVARQHAKPVIVATQMLESMIENPIPTRAEVSDVANAILNGADAIMLSGETAMGAYPIEAVEMMTKICHKMEPEFINLIKVDKVGVTEAVAKATSSIVEDLEIKTIVTSSLSGYTVAEISARRTKPHILAFSPNESTVKKLNLYRSVYPNLIPYTNDDLVLFKSIEKFIHSEKILAEGDVFIYTSGKPGKSGTSNVIKIVTV